ncbi:MAG: transposase, partial [bacterium]
MPRKTRLDVPGTLHHVIARCISELTLFREDQDRLFFLSRLKRICHETKMRILAWALMDNHFHLLLFSIPPGISKFMRRLLTSYSLYYNRKYKRSGHVFQNRFKSIICDKDEYLLELIRYIHLNPWRASIVKRIEELDSHPWCGHKYLIGKEKYDWQEVDYVLAQFAD